MTSQSPLLYWEERYNSLSSQKHQIQDTLDMLSIELEKLEDTWVESTPIMGCLQTSMDVIKHIIKQIEDSQDITWRQIERTREELKRDLGYCN